MLEDHELVRQGVYQWTSLDTSDLQSWDKYALWYSDQTCPYETFSEKWIVTCESDLKKVVTEI